LLDNGLRLDDALGSGFGVITSAELAPPQRDIVAARGARTVHAAAGTELAHWLNRHHVKAAVIRPDRTVMIAGRDPTALCRAVPLFPVDRASDSSPRSGRAHYE
jgi:3-(3-hydroxy-phenyl)propionate hydroxylase